MVDVMYARLFHLSGLSNYVSTVQYSRPGPRNRYLTFKKLLQGTNGVYHSSTWSVGSVGS